MIKENLSYLKEALTFWNHLTEKEQDLLVKNTVPVKYKKGAKIYSADNECSGMLLIKSGELRTYILSEEGREVTLYRLNDGEVCILSASCLLKNITFDVHIDAEKDSEVLLIDSLALSKLSSENPHVENFSLGITADKFSDVMWTMEQILFKSFDQRLAIFLLDEAYKNKRDILKLTHEQIAKYMGSAREVVSRMLNYFAKEGIVELNRGTIRLIDKGRLKELIKTNI
ncbi:Crp/Fnr family transcriptional regulator [Clostridium polynesiense]|uniref:Crp/Fnr family transcriptional regulator n=1 Tax=Clostridium polynesiense TaxID=1325933 RepID=UPI00058FD9B8|nr:Crp/Fnr family transcriptional regulator [Clostridium polynesiense]